MVGLVQLFHPVTGNMGVNLGGRQVRVAQQQLDHAEISAMIQEVGREGVTQCMR